MSVSANNRVSVSDDRRHRGLSRERRGAEHAIPAADRPGPVTRAVTTG